MTRESFQRFVSEIKARKIRKTLALYISISISILGVTNLFTGVYHLPALLFDGALILALCGLPGAVLFAWLHGHESPRKIRPWELAWYGFSLVLAALLIVFVASGPGGRILPRDARTIAVLPFDNLGPSKDDAYLSDGITEDIITQLSGISGLQVVSRTSVMKYKGAQKSMREIGAELGVATILEGSVRRDGARIRIVGQLIDARSDRHLWAETYDREFKDVFAIQSDVARSIAAALQATLKPEEMQRLQRQATASLDAYAFCLRGREYYYRYTKDDNTRAMEMFRTALAYDARYALAYAGLADAMVRRAMYESDPAWADSAIVLATVAVTLDPALPEGYKALGVAYDQKGERMRALGYYEQALRLNPNFAPVVSNIGSLYYSLGAFDRGLPWAQKAVLLNPGFARYSALVGLQFLSLGLDSAAGAWLSRAAALQPDFTFPRVLQMYRGLYAHDRELARTSIQEALAIRPDEFAVLEAAGDLALVEGRNEEAKAIFASCVDRSGSESPAGLKLAFALGRLGEEQAAGRIVGGFLKAYATDPADYPEGSSVPYAVATAYVMAGRSGDALRWLERAVQTGWRNYRWARVDPLMAPGLRDPGIARVIDGVEVMIADMRRAVTDSVPP